MKEKFAEYAANHVEFSSMVFIFVEGESIGSDSISDDGVSFEDEDTEKLEDGGDSDKDEYFQGMTEDKRRVQDWKRN